MHVCNYAFPPRSKRKFWICARCGQRIKTGEEHFRRAYYPQQPTLPFQMTIRLCLRCYAVHAHDYPAGRQGLELDREALRKEITNELEKICHRAS